MYDDREHVYHNPLINSEDFVLFTSIEFLFAFNGYADNVVFTTRLLHSKFIDAVNQMCIDSMLPKWESELVGADQFMSVHCFIVSEALRADPTVAATAQTVRLQTVEVEVLKCSILYFSDQVTYE